MGLGPPEFLDLDYKIQTVSDHVAKFRGDRPRDLGERVAKKINKERKNITGKTNMYSITTVPGGLISNFVGNKDNDIPFGFIT